MQYLVLPWNTQSLKEFSHKPSSLGPLIYKKSHFLCENVGSNLISVILVDIFYGNIEHVYGNIFINEMFPIITSHFSVLLYTASEYG